MKNIFILLALIITFSLNIKQIQTTSSPSQIIERELMLQAVRRGDINEVQRFINQGADLDAPTQGGLIPGYSPLHAAAANSRTDIAQVLIKTGANINAKDRFGKTPLHLATNNSYTAMAQALIESGADINMKDKFGNTPLHDAAQNSRVATIQTLIESGANINVKNLIGNTPLNIAKDTIQQFLQEIVSVENQLQSLTPEQSIGVALDQYNQNLKITWAKRLISQGKFNLATELLQTYPDATQNLDNFTIRKIIKAYSNKYNKGLNTLTNIILTDLPTTPLTIELKKIHKAADTQNKMLQNSQNKRFVDVNIITQV